MTKPDPNHKIGICHNPPGSPGHYNYQEVDEASITKEQGHDNHDGDIIPAFEGYVGKNLTASNVALLGRECVQETTTTRPQADPTTSTTVASTTTTRPSTSTTVTTRSNAPSTTIATLASTTTLGDPTSTVTATVQPMTTLPVTGASPIFAGAGLGLIVVGAAILRSARAASRNR